MFDMFDPLIEGLSSVLAFFFALTNSFGGAIILLTLAVMAVVTPLTLKGTKSMMAMQRLQPDMRRIQQEFKHDRQQLNQEMLQFYRENDINPMGSCLPLLIQMPIFLVLFQVVKGITKIGANGTFAPDNLSTSTELYQALDNAKEMLFLGFDLEKSPLNALKDRGFIVALPYLVLIALWVSTSFLQQIQVSGRSTDAMSPQQKMMMRVIPVFSLTALWFPAALSVYWVTSNVCRLATQGYISHRFYNMGMLGFGKKRDGEASAVIDVKAKPAKPSNPSTSGGSAKTVKPSAGTSSGSNGARKAPTSGRATPAKGKSAADRPRSPAPGRRNTSTAGPAKGSATGERPRRRVPNGPATPTGDAASSNGGVGGSAKHDGPRDKRRK
ncbi:MAG: membrane protein insertase YidC [Acidimicrobiales bacterium]